MHGTAEDPGEARRRALLLKLLARSRYRRALQPQAERICEVALRNAQVARALDSILADSDHAALGDIDPRRHAGALATLRHLFEWIHFASPEFVERARRG